MASRVLRVGIALVAIGSAFVWLLDWQFRYPGTLGLLLTSLVSLSAAGDWLNFCYLRQRLDGDDGRSSGTLRT